MILVNAVYFKGLWENQFDSSDTIDQDFYVTPEKTIKVPMMHVEKEFRYSTREDLNADVLAMDYKVSSMGLFLTLCIKLLCTITE